MLESWKSLSKLQISHIPNAPLLTCYRVLKMKENIVIVYEAGITIVSPDKDSAKRKLQLNVTYEYWYKVVNISKSNLFHFFL